MALLGGPETWMIAPVRNDFEENRFSDGNPIAFELCDLLGIIGDKAYFSNTQITQDLRSNSIIAQICPVRIVRFMPLLNGVCLIAERS